MIKDKRLIDKENEKYGTRGTKVLKKNLGEIKINGSKRSVGMSQSRVDKEKKGHGGRNTREGNGESKRNQTGDDRRGGEKKEEANGRERGKNRGNKRGIQKNTKGTHKEMGDNSWKMRHGRKTREQRREKEGTHGEGTEGWQNGEKGNTGEKQGRE